MTHKLDMHRRIRRRRAVLGLSATDLAERAGITPSYVSVIEAGDRVPSEEVAVRLAKALDDDPDLYLAWAHAREIKDLPRYLDRMKKLLHLRNDPEMRDRVGLGETLGVEDYDEATLHDQLKPIRAMRMRSASERKRNRQSGPPPSADPVPVPVLQDGFDPGDDPMNADGVIGTIPLPEQVLPPDVVGPFAYRPGKNAVRRVSDEMAPGSLVVLSTRPGLLDAGHIQAVRHEGRVILSRVLQRSDSMVLLHDTDSSQVEVVDLAEGESALDRIAGTVVLVLKFWEGAMQPREEPVPLQSLAMEKSIMAEQDDLLEELVHKKMTDVAAPKRMSDRNMAFVAEHPYHYGPTGRPGRPTTARLEGEFLVRDCPWTDSYGWRPIQKAEDMDFLDENPGTKIRFNLMKDDQIRYVLEMTPDQWRESLGDYYEGDTWRTNGYIVAITKRRKGVYTEEFQERWGKWVKTN